MIPEIGHFALIIALCIAMAQAVLSLVGAWKGMPTLMAVARPAPRYRVAVEPQTAAVRRVPLVRSALVHPAAAQRRWR